MPAVSSNRLADVVRDAAHPLTGAPEDFDPILALVGDARFVLIGEASHGTHEFYRIRAEITKRLIREKGFGSVAVEADWPDAYRVNRYVRGRAADADGVTPLDAAMGKMRGRGRALGDVHEQTAQLLRDLLAAKSGSD